MKKNTTQEILGTPNFQSNVVAYLLHATYEPEEGEKEVSLPDDEITLLVGALLDKKECFRAVKKFHAFLEIPLYNKEDGKSLWLGKFHEVLKKEEKEEKEEKE